MNCLRRFHHESIADFAVRLEDHDRAGVLFRQPYIAARDIVANDLASPESCQHITNRKSVIRAAIDNNNLVLTDL